MGAIGVRAGERSPHRIKLEAQLAAAGGGPLSARDLADRYHLDWETTRKALWRMTKEGTVRSTPDGYLLVRVQSTPPPAEDDFYRYHWGA